MADDIDVHEAGRQIAQRGLTDDVRRGRTNRELARDGDSADADDRTEDRRPGKRDRDEDDRRSRRRDDEDERPRAKRREPDEDDEYFEDEDDRQDDEDEDADPSNREDGEDGETDDDEDDDADGDDERGNREREFKVKVNGQTITVPESELIAGYSRNKDYQHKTQRLAETHRELQTGHSQVAEQYGKRLQTLNSVVSMLKRELVGQLDNAAMERLYAENPAAWQKARADIEKRVKTVDTVFNHLNEETERHRKDFEAHQAAHKQRVMSYEVEQIKQHVPDWFEGKDGKPAGHARVANYLRKAGFKDQEFSDVIDHRMLLIAEKARRYDTMMERRDERGEPKRRAKPVPKRVPKGGGSRNVQPQGTREDRQGKSEFRQARDRLAKSGDMRDAGNAIDAMLTNQTRREERRKRRFR